MILCERGLFSVVLAGLFRLLFILKCLTEVVDLQFFSSTSRIIHSGLICSVVIITWEVLIKPETCWYQQQGLTVCLKSDIFHPGPKRRQNKKRSHYQMRMKVKEKWRMKRANLFRASSMMVINLGWKVSPSKLSCPWKVKASISRIWCCHLLCNVCITLCNLFLTFPLSSLTQLDNLIPCSVPFSEVAEDQPKLSKKELKKLKKKVSFVGCL